MRRQRHCEGLIVRAAGAAIPSRGKNNGATTTISFHSFNLAISTKGASVFCLLAEMLLTFELDKSYFFIFMYA
jgi:hypothetical protein